MKKRAWLLLIFLLCWPAFSSAASFDFTLYDRLLKKYVTTDHKVNGIPAHLVDYRQWHWDQQFKGSRWRTLLGKLAAFDPSTLSNRNEKLAFWSNVYNIAAIKMVLDHWPVDSIRSRSIHWLGQPWKQSIIMVGGKNYSLHALEFDRLIDGLNDMRAHVAINCASLSCVDLPTEPFVAERIDAQLQASGERFFSLPQKGYRIDRAQGVVYVSQIFKFDRDRFDARVGGPIPFLLRFVTDSADLTYLQKGGYRLKYLPYDWTINNAQRTKR